ncbi:MAG: DMT family transporter [Rugosibacter sp.]|nr:MAG: DMT family transporter [Rugosibacter sp.]TBR07860.1 MAG: DMT family transporter [Rugosibacter sp.]
MTNQGVIGQRTAWMLLAAVVLFWGVNWPVMKYGLHYVPPLTFAALRMIMGAIVLAAVATWRHELRFPHREDWPLVLGVGLLQMAAFMGLVNVGLQYVPAGRSAILAYTTPLWVVPLAVLWLGEVLTTLRIVGLVLGMIGVAVLFNPFAFDWHDPKTVLGNGMLLFAALLWAILIVKVRGHRWKGSPLSLMPWQLMVAACAMAPFIYLFEDVRTIQWGEPLGWVLLYNGPIATAFCFWAMISVTRALPAITTSLSLLCVPVVGYVSASLVLGEAVTLTNSLGFALILGGLIFATVSDWKKSQEAKSALANATITTATTEAISNGTTK